ncbi:MAG TPA: carbohydrate ABC transporter permease [Spirochaetia bacterium]|nr:carbohydrate ABC transporter permease [Spirochaetia bacterium]
MFFFTIVSLVMLFPFIVMVLTSLKTMAEIQSPVFKLLPKVPQFSNYYTAMTQGAWGRYFLNSFGVTASTVLFAVTFNSIAGYAFARLRFPGRNLIFFILLLGIMVPPQTAMVPAFLILKNMPLFGGNNIFGAGGTGLVNTYGGLVIPFVAGSIGIFLCRQFYMAFPTTLDDAAEIDGASKLRSFFQIYLPLSKPLLATLAITKSTATWNDYVWPLIITTGNAHMTVQLALAMFETQYTVVWNQLMAATTLVVLPLVIVFFLFQRYFVQGIVTTGLR